MKRIISTIAAVLLLCSLAACSQKKVPYEIKEIDGDWYLIVDEELRYEHPKDMCGIYDCSLYFGSLEEMRSDLLLGNLTDRELQHLGMFTRDEEGKARICDLDNLWECAYPESLDVGSVSLKNSRYIFALIGDHLESAIFYLYPQDQWHESVEFYANYDQYDRVEHCGKDTEEDRNAIVFVYKLNKEETERKLVVYTISEEDKTLHVYEWYDLAESSEVPSDVEIYGEHHGDYFYVSIDGLTERPSVEWLSLFGIKEYA